MWRHEIGYHSFVLNCKDLLFELMGYYLNSDALEYITEHIWPSISDILKSQYYIEDLLRKRNIIGSSPKFIDLDSLILMMHENHVFDILK